MEDKKRKKEDKRKRETSQKVSVFSLHVITDKASSVMSWARSLLKLDFACSQLQKLTVSG